MYKFETLVIIEVLPLRLDAAIPAPLPMLETLSKIFNGNAVKWQLRAATAEGKQSVSSFSTVLCYGFDDRGLIPDRSFCCGVQVDSGAHPASYTVVIKGSFAGYKSRMT